MPEVDNVRVFRGTASGRVHSVRPAWWRQPSHCLHPMATAHAGTPLGYADEHRRQQQPPHRPETPALEMTELSRTFLSVFKIKLNVFGRLSSYILHFFMIQISNFWLDPTPLPCQTSMNHRSTRIRQPPQRYGYAAYVSPSSAQFSQQLSGISSSASL